MGKKGAIEPFLNDENLDVARVEEEENEQNIQQPSTSNAMPRAAPRVLANRFLNILRIFLFISRVAGNSIRKGPTIPNDAIFSFHKIKLKK